MTSSIDIRELPARFEEAISLASAGNEVILVEGSPPARAWFPLDLRPGAFQAYIPVQ